MAVNTVQTFNSPINRLLDADTSLFFTTENAQLGVSDGTNLGTSILNSDGDGDDYEGLNGRVLFDGFSDESGEEPFANNGTVDGTSILLDIEPRDSETSDPSNFFAVGDIAYFTAFNQANGIALYNSDGTSDGTSLVADIDDESSRFSNPFAEFTDFNGTLYFAGDERENGNALWRSDGTLEGTEIVSRFESSFTSLGNLTAAEENLYFTRPSELWVSDGSTEGTELIFDNITNVTNISPVAVGSSIYFSADRRERNIGQELWTSDGTTEGTRLVRDIFMEDRIGGSPRNLGSNPENLTDVGGRLFFTADDGDTGRELWISDGTEDSTRRVADLTEGEGSSQFSNFTEANGKLYFIKDGDELWQSDGTQPGTFELESEEINLGGTTTPAFRNPEGLIEFDNQLYFTGESYDSNTGGYVDALLTPEDSNTVSRLSNPDIGVHFYTTNASERDEYVGLGYEPEGSSFTVVDPTAEDAVGVYRFFNETTEVNIYTTNEMEIGNLEQNSQFTSAGVVFNAYQTQIEGSIPIYRLRNGTTNTHLFTPSVGERDTVLETLDNFVSEGIAYYALPLEDA